MGTISGWMVNANNVTFYEWCITQNKTVLTGPNIGWGNSAQDVINRIISGNIVPPNNMPPINFAISQILCRPFMIPDQHCSQPGTIWQGNNYVGP